jgi:hypothetical protein
LPHAGEAGGAFADGGLPRIWLKHRLKPHRVKGFKVSNDPQFAGKLREVAGLYLDPPEKAALSFPSMRKAADPGPGSHAAGLADEAGQERNDDP